MNPLICVMNGSGVEEISEESLALSNMRGFNNNVGSATNKASAIRDKMFYFNEDSKEYKELFKREQSIQRIQQSIIDSIKTGKSEQVPKCWYDNAKNEIVDEDYIYKLLEKNPNSKIPKMDSDLDIEKKLFNQKIVADKKPYYFSYIYTEIMNEIKKYNDNWKHNCMRVCGLTVDELKKKTHKTEFESELLKAYQDNFPVSDAPSVMNKICHKFEEEFDGYFSKKENKTNFDHQILKSNVDYEKKQYNKVNKVQLEYKEQVKKFFMDRRNGKSEEDSDLARRRFIETFKRKAMISCEDEDILCDIVIDMTYGKNKNHQFAWDVCGDVIIKNLLKLNNNKIIYFQKDRDGTIEYCGENFTKRTMQF